MCNQPEETIEEAAQPGVNIDKLAVAERLMTELGIDAKQVLDFLEVSEEGKQEFARRMEEAVSDR